MVLVLGLFAVLTACGSGGDASESDDLDEPLPPVSLTEPTATVSVPTGCQGGGTVIVFVNPAVTDARVAEIGVELQALPSVASLVYVDQQQAFDEFQELYKDDPDKLAAVTPEILPPSYRLTLTDAGHADDIEAAASGLDGVGEVIC